MTPDPAPEPRRRSISTFAIAVVGILAVMAAFSALVYAAETDTARPSALAPSEWEEWEEALERMDRDLLWQFDVKDRERALYLASIEYRQELVADVLAALPEDMAVCERITTAIVARTVIYAVQTDDIFDPVGGLGVSANLDVKDVGEAIREIQAAAAAACSEGARS